MNWHGKMNYTPVMVSLYPSNRIVIQLTPNCFHSLEKAKFCFFSYIFQWYIIDNAQEMVGCTEVSYSVLLSFSQTLDFQKFYQCCHQQSLGCWGSSVTVNISVTDATDKVIQPHTSEVSSLLWPTISVCNTLRKLRGLSGQGHFKTVMISFKRRALY